MAKLYDLFRTKGNHKVLMMTDNHKKIKTYLKSIAASQRKMGYTYSIEESTAKDKFKKKHKFRSH